MSEALELHTDLDAAQIREHQNLRGLIGGGLGDTEVLKNSRCEFV